MKSISDAGGSLSGESGDGAAIVAVSPDAGEVGAAVPRGGKRGRGQSERMGEDTRK